MLDNGLISQAIELLRPEDFYVPSHRRIFIAMIALFERGAEINPILIGEELKKENALESVGGISFITNLTYGLPHSTNIAHYAKVVRGKSMLRQLIKAANKITQEALEQEDEPEIILDHAEQAIFQLADERIRQGFVHVKPVAEQLLEKVQEMEGRAAVLTGLTTGFADLDKMTSGLQTTGPDNCCRPSFDGQNQFRLNAGRKRSNSRRRSGGSFFVGNVEGSSGDAHALFARQHRCATISQWLPFAARMGPDRKVAGHSRRLEDISRRHGRASRYSRCVLSRVAWPLNRSNSI